VARFRERHAHKHKKHSHVTVSSRKHELVSESTAHHKTITLDSIPDSLLPHRSLVNYVDDCPKLLDEVFSIFSEEEICSMLPDILKGIELDEVKKLCYDQLIGMDTTTIKDTIQSHSEGVGNSKHDGVSTGGDDKPTSHDPHHESHELCKELIDHSPKEQSSHVKEMDTPSVEMDTSNTGTVTTDVSSMVATPNVVDTASHGEDSIELSAFVGDDIDRELTLSVPSQGSTGSRDTATSVVQDSLSIEPETSTHKPAQPVGDTEVIPSQETTSQPPSDSVMSIDNDVMELTDLEQQLRQKALQSQLKKQQQDKMLNDLRAKEELLLRQKALQSMLAAKKNKT